MNKRRHIRFSMATLLLATTAAALFLGYSQWRRKWMLTEIRALRAEGVLVAVKSDWIDRLWLRTPEEGLIYFADVSPTLRRLGSGVYDWKERDGDQHYDSLEKRCRYLGVKDVFCMKTSSDNLRLMMESKNRSQGL
jgi:hypothetical protein